MKIDLHCHTKKIKNGDSEKRNVTTSRFFDAMANANVGIVAITNHNHFDIVQYNDFNTSDNDLQVWPGVELDVLGNKSGDNIHGHITVITAPENAEKLSKLINTNCSGDPENFIINIDDVLDFLKPLKKYLIACHYMKKPSLAKEDIQFLISNCNNNSVVVLEPSDMRRAGIALAGNNKCWFGSDNKNWDEYEKEALPELIFKIDSFETFLDLLKNKSNPVLLNSYLDKKGPIEISVSPYSDLNLNLKIFRDVNIIFGQKATGKTDILRSIETELVKMNYSVSSFYVEDKHDELLQIVNYHPNDGDLSVLSKFYCEDILEDIANWDLVQIPSLNDYYKYNLHSKKRSVFSRLDITKSSFSGTFNDLELKKSKDELINNLESINEVNLIEKNSILTLNEQNKLSSLLAKLSLGLKNKYLDSWIKNESKKLEKLTIETIKDKLAIEQGVPVKPSGTGLLDVYEDFKKGYLYLKQIEESLESSCELSEVEIGNLPTKGKILRKTFFGIKGQRSSSHSAWTKRTYIETGVTQTKHKEFVKKTKSLFNSLLDNSFSSNLETFKKYLDDNQIKSLKRFTNYSNFLVNNTNDDFKPSNGEQSILMVQNALMNDKTDAILLDEAESGMGADYVNGPLLDEIKKHADHNKIIIIVTHDPNIVVRTHPYQCIYRIEYDPGKYKTYVGSSFEEYLHNVDDEGDKIKWITACISICEGGEEAFKERGLTYGEHGFY